MKKQLSKVVLILTVLTLFMCIFSPVYASKEYEIGIADRFVCQRQAEDENFLYMLYEDKLSVINKFFGQIVSYEDAYFLNVREENGAPVYFTKKENLFSEGLMWVRKNGKAGCIDAYGNVVIDFLYDEAMEFQNAMSVVKKDGYYGVINIDNQSIIPCVYETISRHQENFAAQKNNQLIIFDAYGNILSTLGDEYQFVNMPYNGFLFVRNVALQKVQEDGSGVITTTQVPKFSDLKGYDQLFYTNYYRDLVSECEAFAEALQYGYSFINTKGEVIFEGLEAKVKVEIVSSRVQPDPYPHIAVYFTPSKFTDAGIAIVKKNGLYGIIDQDGTGIQDFAMTECWDYGDYIVGQILDTLLLMDTRGNVFFERDATQCVESFVSGGERFFILKTEETYGVIDSSGQTRVPFVYETLYLPAVYSPKSEDSLIEAQKDGRWGAIDPNNQILVPFQFDDILTAANFTYLAVVETEERQYIYEVAKQRRIPISNKAVSMKKINDKAVALETYPDMSGIPDTQGVQVLNQFGERITFPYVIRSVWRHGTDFVEINGIDGTDYLYDTDLNLIFYKKGGHIYTPENQEIGWAGLQYDRLPVPSALNEMSAGVTANGSIIYWGVFEKYAKPPAGAGTYICMQPRNPYISVNGTSRLIERDNLFFTPYIENNRVLLPLEAVCELWNADGGYDAVSRTVSIEKDGMVFTFQIDKNEMYVNQDQMIWLDTPPRMLCGKVLVPVYRIAEILGFTEVWDPVSNTVTFVK